MVISGRRQSSSPFGIGEDIGARPQCLADPVEEQARGLNESGRDALIARATEQAHQAFRLRLQGLELDCTFSRHDLRCRARSSCTAATISVSGTENCAGRPSRHSLRVLDLAGKARAFEQILDRDLALRALVLALNDDAWAAAPVGIFHLRLHAGVADVHFGADARLAQIARHFLIVADPGFIHDQHHDGRYRRWPPAESCRDAIRRGIKPRNAD